MMIDSRTALLAGGALHLLWAAFHLAFPRLFRWNTALVSLDRVNQGILRVLNLCLAFQFLVLGWLSLAFTDELFATPLGRALCAGLAGFWLLRLGLQCSHFRALDPRSLVLSAFFAATCAAYAAPLFL
ncbi:MAG: hypothetical protein A2051_00635 [Desulfovibrionales bacterium GWA2_65_9]|nr:MAG: hypothetical protein A2051_00635 [Desulfovibrionales bacterium GWA2_65_9]